METFYSTVRPHQARRTTSSQALVVIRRSQEIPTMSDSFDSFGASLKKGLSPNTVDLGLGGRCDAPPFPFRDVGGEEEGRSTADRPLQPNPQFKLDDLPFASSNHTPLSLSLSVSHYSIFALFCKVAVRASLLFLRDARRQEGLSLTRDHCSARHPEWTLPRWK
jgi:hypothetical protein